MRIRNQDARHHVLRKEDFDCCNMFARKINILDGTPLYITYSYGLHFPMYVFDYAASQWFGNSDKYSRSTTRHQNLTRPPTVHRWFETDELIAVIRAGGIANYVARSLKRAA